MKRPDPTRGISCANFSGDWKGSCTISNHSGSQDVQWKITQRECGDLKIESGDSVQEHYLNATKTVTADGGNSPFFGPGPVTHTMGFQWQNENQGLGFSFVAYKLDRVIEAHEGTFRLNGPAKLNYRDISKTGVVTDCNLAK